MGNQWSATPSSSEINMDEDEPPDEAPGSGHLNLMLLDVRSLSLSNLDCQQSKSAKIHTLLRVKASFHAKIYTKPVKYVNETSRLLLPSTKFVFAGSEPNGDITVSLMQSNLPPLPAIPLSDGGSLSPSSNGSSEKPTCLAKIVVPVSMDDFKTQKQTQKWIRVENCKLSEGSTEVPEVLVGLKYCPISYKTHQLKLGETITDRYDVDNILGSGRNIVKKAKHKSSKKDFAIKFLSKEHKGQKIPKQTLEREVEILRSLSHENIVQLCETVETSDTVYMVMELVDGVDLFDVSQILGTLQPALAGLLVGQILSAVAYLHARGIVHQDLKPENILVDYTRSKVKLADFGSAKEVKKMTGVEGTLNYMAPEMINRMRGANQNCDCAVDIWGIGVIAFILLTGKHPFDSPSMKNNNNIIHRILSGKVEYPSPLWDSVPKHCKDFIQKCLVVDPKKRASAQDLLKHPWIVASSSTTFSATEQKKLESERTSRSNSRTNSVQSLLELFGNSAVPSRS